MMRCLISFSIVLLLAACAAPLTEEDREAAHQLQLAREARENFYALKAQEHPGFVPPQQPTPTPNPGLFSSLAPHRVVPRHTMPPPSNARRPVDDTIYWNPNARPTSGRFS